MAAEHHLPSSASYQALTASLMALVLQFVLAGAHPALASDDLPATSRLLASNEDSFFAESLRSPHIESLGAAGSAIKANEDPEAVQDFQFEDDNTPVAEEQDAGGDHSVVPTPTPRPDVPTSGAQTHRNRNRLDSVLGLLPAAIHKNLRSAGIPSVPLARAIDFRQRMIDGGYDINLDQLVVADLTLENDRDRMWLIDLKTGKAKGYRTAHGSGGRHGNAWMCAHRFGNRDDKLTSPGGGFVFGCAFRGSKIPRLRRSIGAKRRSVWMIGMDAANKNSARRAVIFHEGYSINSGALYTDNKGGGRSSGCLTIKPSAYQSFENSISQPKSCPQHFPTRPAGGAPVYVYPERSDVLADNPVYWDVKCSEYLLKKKKRRQFIE